MRALVEYTTFQPSSRSLGSLAAFVSQHAPFTQYEFGPVMKTLIYQLEHCTHAVAMARDPVTGELSQMLSYVGWVRTTDAVAREWLENEGRLTMSSGKHDAIAVTILATDDPASVIGLIKHAKKMNAGKSVYWKRYFMDGRAPSSRRVVKKGKAGS
ncbi:MAG: hypothetical protein ABJM26_19590 [Anderseniella sp.]